jgi:hypothetical protein
MQQIMGGCHCGNIQYEFVWPLDEAHIPVRACSCSFCVKHGGTYTSHPEAELKAVMTDPAQVMKYTFGTKTADFYVCSRCGVLLFAVSRIDNCDYAVVNVHTFEGIDPAQLISRVTNFDGESVERRLERRKKTWTPAVKVSVAGV